MTAPTLESGDAPITEVLGRLVKVEGTFVSAVSQNLPLGTS